MFTQDIRESVSIKILSFITILVTAGVFYPTDVMASTIMSDTFGTGSSSDNISSWEEEGDDDDSSTRAQSADNSGDEMYSPADGNDDGRFAKIGEDEWICREVNASGHSSMVLKYYWRGDGDAENDDFGIVEYRSSGSSCTSSSWTNLAQHALDDSSSSSSTSQEPWSSLQSINLPASLNNSTFTIRFRNSASQSDEYFRVDGISIEDGDSIAPTVTNVTSSTANGSYNAGDVVSVQVTFSETVLVTGTPRITLETGATDRDVNFSSGSNSSTLTFNYTVQAGDTSSDLNYTGTTALALNSGTIKDAAGNNATLTLPSTGSGTSLGGNKNIVIDTTAPVVAEVTPVPTPDNDSTPNYTFNSTETGAITYAGGCTSGTANAASGNNAITFTSLTDGTYASCTVKVTDAAGNQSNTLGITSFTVDTTPPVITVLGDNPLELGTGDTFTDPGATAQDSVDGSISVATAHSVNTAVPNTYTVSYSATDVAGNTANASRAVEVSDDDGPEFFGMPGDMIVEALDLAGAIVNYILPTAVDNVDGDVSSSVSCTPASGSVFPFGNTVVGCLVSDAALNETSASFNVLVQDTTDPILTVLPGDQTIEATSAAGAIATFAVSANDNINGDVSGTIVCDALSGNTFAIGVTTVTCTAEDGASNEGLITFNITVEDTTAPIVTIDPATQSISVTAPSIATADFSASATDLVDSDVTIVCNPAAGSTLPNGITTITCTGTDDAGNQGVATSVFTVTGGMDSGGSTDSSPFEPTTETSGSTDESSASETTDTADGEQTSDIGEAVVEEVAGEVAGASCTLFDAYIGMGTDNADDVKMLQEFLNKEMGLTLEVNGEYDSATIEAIKAFQLKYATEILAPWGITNATGIVYKTTQRMINMLSCPGTEIPMPELF